MLFRFRAVAEASPEALHRGEVPGAWKVALVWACGLPAVTVNELAGYLPACLQIDWHERLRVAYGLAGEVVLRAWTAACRFDGVDVRWPHALASTLALLVASHGARRRRSLRERLVVLGFLLGTPHALYWGHHARPYAFHLLAGLTVWVYRGHLGFAWPRVLANAWATLNAPFATPLWAAAVVANVARLRRRPHGLPPVFAPAERKHKAEGKENATDGHAHSGHEDRRILDLRIRHRIGQCEDQKEQKADDGAEADPDQGAGQKKKNRVFTFLWHDLSGAHHIDREEPV
jgi:hypothetical protein